jgi:hypothetical protein
MQEKEETEAAMTAPKVPPPAPKYVWACMDCSFATTDETVADQHQKDTVDHLHCFHRRTLAYAQAPAPPSTAEPPELFSKDYAFQEAARLDLLLWAVERWRAEVGNRPLVNIHRRSLDDTWRQVIRYANGDPDLLIGPDHDSLLAGSEASPQDSLAHDLEIVLRAHSSNDADVILQRYSASQEAAPSDSRSLPSESKEPK